MDGLVEIQTLEKGQRFKFPDTSEGEGRSGRLIHANECRAHIIYDTRYTTVTGTDGKKTKLPSYESPMDISPCALVFPIPMEGK